VPSTAETRFFAHSPGSMSQDYKEDSAAPPAQPSAAPSKHSKAKSSTASAAAAADADPFSAVKRNAKGGIHVSAGELHQAFEFFDVEGKGFITISDLKKRLGVFYQNLSLREYKFLMNNKQELTEQELYTLLANNELTNYDPVAEAFKVTAKQRKQTRIEIIAMACNAHGRSLLFDVVLNSFSCCCVDLRPE
jgi:hypothetical protein